MPRAAVAAVLVILLPILVGCAGLGDDPGGSRAGPAPAAPRPDTGAAEMSGTEPAITSTEPSPEPPELAPPPIVLASGSGRQKALQESYCVQRVDESGQGVAICEDTFEQDPARLTVVRPGETITISMPGATITTDGEASVSIRPLGCHDRELGRIPLEPDATEWTVGLDPGAYELQVFVRFEATDGRTGDSSASLGLLVDPNIESGTLRAKRALFVCQPSGEG